MSNEGGPKDGDQKKLSPFGLAKRPAGPGTGLARPGLPGGLVRPATAAEQRAVGDFKAQGANQVRLLGEGAQQAREARRQEAEKRAEEGVKAIAKKMKLKLGVAIDYTASAISEADEFVRDSGRLVGELQEIFPEGVEVLPAVFKGTGELTMRPTAMGLAGPKNDIGWFKKVSHATNGRNEPPIVAGMQAITRQGFYNEDPNDTVHAMVIISDNGFVSKDNGYEDTILHIIDSGVAVADFVVPDTRFADGPETLKAMIESHVMGIITPLWEKGIVVQRGNKEQMHPVDLMREFILNQRDVKAGAVYASTVPQPQYVDEADVEGPLKSPFKPFADHLRALGTQGTKQAAMITQGQPRSQKPPKGFLGR